MNSESRDGQVCPGRINEQRRRPRLVPAQGSAFVFLGSEAMVAGPVLNISQDGLALRYVARRRKTEGIVAVDIFVQTGDFRLEGIPCRVVWDSANPRDWSTGPFSVRHCGIEFDDLNHEKTSELCRFIRLHGRLPTD